MINRLIASILPYFPERFVWIFSKKYIAGKDIDSAIDCITRLHQDDILATVDILGEAVNSPEEAESYLAQYLDAIQILSGYHFGLSMSIKPTMFGLHTHFDTCHANLRQILSLAKEKDLFIRIDMEDSSCTDLELALFEMLYKEFPAHVGIVLQAYLKRSMDDLDRLKRIEIPGYPVNIRLCKGIYIEPRKIAFKSRQDIHDNFIRCLEKMLRLQFYPALATHDKKLIYACLKLIETQKLRHDQYEFQMLLGVTPRLRKELTQHHHRMRVYVPFGNQWFRYATRRLQENPHMVRDIITGIIIPK